jgi:RNA polymerase sigma factor (sigma-70 family)
LTPEQQLLATQHLALARSLVRRFKQTWRSEADDFESVAYVALVEAARLFDPDRNVKFSTFAHHRIRGALIDLQKKLIVSRYRNGSETSPTFQRLGDDTEQYGRVLCATPEEPVGTELEAVEAVESWLRTIPGSHARACRHIYIEGLSQDEVAERIGCSKSYVSKLHREALAWLTESVQRARSSWREGAGAWTSLVADAIPLQGATALGPTVAIAG